MIVLPDVTIFDHVNSNIIVVHTLRARVDAGEAVAAALVEIILWVDKEWRASGTTRADEKDDIGQCHHC